MKNIYRNLIVMVLCLPLFIACEEEDALVLDSDEAIPHFTEESFNLIASPGDEGYDLTVGFTNGNATTVELVILESSTAIEGVHFESFSKSVSIAAGEYTGSVRIVPIVSNLDEAYVLDIGIANSPVAEGVQFNQNFRLNLSRFCSLQIAEWATTFDCLEPGYGNYNVEFSLGVDDNTIVADNFWDFGGNVVYTFSESSSPAEAIVTIEEQTVLMGGSEYIVEGSGTYEQCSKQMVVDYTVILAADGSIQDENTHTFTLL